MCLCIHIYIYIYRERGGGEIPRSKRHGVEFTDRMQNTLPSHRELAMYAVCCMSMMHDI